MANDHIADDRKKVRLIDANALLLEIEEELAHESPFFTHEKNEMIDCGLRIAAKDIRHQPTVDAVEVVRCKDCKKCHSWEAPNGATGYECDYHGEDVKLDDFCSYGERRTDG